MPESTPDIPAGLIPAGLQAIHANQLEDLRHAVIWLGKTYPLAPLDEEVFLVQSNGIAQWLKLALAETPLDDGGGCGISAGNAFLLPHRFVWRAYRSILGHEGVPESSPFDKDRLVWRLYAILPELVASDDDLYAPLARFMDGSRPQQRRFQLAQRLADLFDQYQVFRADWLTDWAAGSNELTLARGGAQPLPEAQRWQPALWRALVERIGEALPSRASIHQRFIDTGRALEPSKRPPGLPPRVVVFGVSSLPQQTLEVLDVIGRFSQVVLCVHNPCRYYWADIISDRDLLMASRRRAGQKQGMPADVSETELHQHAQPLLAAWGKQGRDYIRLLDSFDDPEVYRNQFQTAGQRVDIFQPPEGEQLLHYLQNDICELRPLAETRDVWPAIDPQSDSSIVFHMAHSPLRELEILHDQLLAAFSADAELRPRDVIVMVPDINTYAPAIQATFGRHDAQDIRHIPFTISDQGLRHRQPLVVALEMLLGLPDSRFSASEVLSLLEIEAVRARFGIAAGDLPLLATWVAGANICWGLDGRQRASLGLPANLDCNTWRFGLERMLLGYATGDSPAWEDIEPYEEIGGLEAQLAGRLSLFIDALDRLLAALGLEQSPADWSQTMKDLQADFLLVESQADIMIQARLQDTLEQWLEACEDAGLDHESELPLAIVREVMLESLDESGLNQRFLAGRVNFATLMPMRAIPFRHVCLLGMNDGDYPRSRPPVDFDLMATDYRPGDRSRREDDRYLFLEALLSARDRLYVSWVGRSVKDNSVRPPSVLVAQLRDHLDAGWSLVDATEPVAPKAARSLVDRLTLEHPLQAFSMDYYPERSSRPDTPKAFATLINNGALFTFDSSWRHNESVLARPASGAKPAALQDEVISLAELAAFLKKPVEHFYVNRLGLRFADEETASVDSEPFALGGLELWGLRNGLITESISGADSMDAHLSSVEAALARLARKGELGLGSSVEVLGQKASEPLEKMFESYQDLLSDWPEQSDRRLLIHGEAGAGAVTLEDSVSGFRANSEGQLCLLSMTASALVKPQKGYQFTQMIEPWVRHLAAAAAEPAVSVTSKLISPAGSVDFEPLGADEARTYLDAMLAAYLAGSQRPLPLELKSGFGGLAGGGINKEGETQPVGTEVEKASKLYDAELTYSAYLQRAWPDFNVMLSHGQSSNREDGHSEYTDLVRCLYVPLWDMVKNKQKRRGGKGE